MAAALLAVAAAWAAPASVDLLPRWVDEQARLAAGPVAAPLPALLKVQAAEWVQSWRLLVGLRLSQASLATHSTPSFAKGGQLEALQQASEPQAVLPVVSQAFQVWVDVAQEPEAGAVTQMEKALALRVVEEVLAVALELAQAPQIE